MARTESSNFTQSMEDGNLFVTGEIPTGTVNGSNVSFTLTNAPNPSDSLELTVNGAEQKLTEDYTLSGDTITMVSAPPQGSLLKADYRVEPT